MLLQLAPQPLELRPHGRIVRQPDLVLLEQAQDVEELLVDSGDYNALLDKALDKFGWPALQEEIRTRRGKGETVGAGIAFFLFRFVQLG